MRPVTVRALNILTAFSRDKPALTLSEISRKTGEPVSTCHRLLTDLLAWGAVDRYGSIYTIGQRLWATGLLAPAHTNIKEIAAPYMQDVLFATRHVVNLQVCVGTDALMVERIAGTWVGTAAVCIGDVTPLHATAGGKVLLAFMEAQQQRQITSEIAGMQKSPSQTTKILTDQIGQIRNQGWATTHGDLKPGFHGLAVPVRDDQQRTLAALSVVMVDESPNVGRLLPVLQVAARAIGRQWQSALMDQNTAVSSS